MCTLSLVLEGSWSNMRWTPMILILLSSTLTSELLASCSCKCSQTRFHQGLCADYNTCLESYSWKCPCGLFPHFDQASVWISSYWRVHSLSTPPVFLYSLFYDLLHYVFFVHSLFPHTGMQNSTRARALLCSLLCCQDLEPCLAYSRCPINIRYIYGWPPKFRYRMHANDHQDPPNGRVKVSVILYNLGLS